MLIFCYVYKNDRVHNFTIIDTCTQIHVHLVSQRTITQKSEYGKYCTGNMKIRYGKQFLYESRKTSYYPPLHEMHEYARYCIFYRNYQNVASFLTYTNE